MNYNIAVIGATGNVGREILNTLFESKVVRVGKIFVFASESSSGKEVSYGNANLKVQHMRSCNFDDIDIVFFATSHKISKEYVPIASKKVKLVVDLSSYFRMDKNIPLVVPEVNLEDLKLAKKSRIVTNPNCVVIPMVVALKRLNDHSQISRIVVSTYQSVSGAGKKAMDKLYSETKEKVLATFHESDAKTNMAFNIISQIDALTESGYTKEEIKIIDETKKILSEDIDVSPTCVRVPVFVGHSMSANVEFSKNISPKMAYDILNKSEGVITDKQHGSNYFTPLDCVGRPEVFVSRVRQDTAKNILNLWIVSDNLRKGAALNAVQIAEKYIEHYI
jgi:aspartate-semialdehyde dehydrogenase